MVVAIEEGLWRLKKELEQAGHTVVNLHAFHGAVEAVIYEDAALYDIQPALQNFSASGAGILMLAARGLSTKDILKRLERRSTDGAGLF